MMRDLLCAVVEQSSFLYQCLPTPSVPILPFPWLVPPSLSLITSCVSCQTPWCVVTWRQDPGTVKRLPNDRVVGLLGYGTLTNTHQLTQ